MLDDPRSLWKRYRDHLFDDAGLGLRLDVSRMPFDEEFLDRMASPMAAAFRDMEALEGGAIANPDEGRQVGHYWLRDPDRAPDPGIRRAIRDQVAAVHAFAARVHDGSLAPPEGGRFRNLLSIGIGGSALGPQLLADALGEPRDPMRAFFLDNTDPDGFDRVFRQIGAGEAGLSGTLVVVISKSGGTVETRNGMLEATHALRQAGLDLPPRAVAVTGEDSALDRRAASEGWLARFPMWDWVGGRTSVTSAVGLVPARLLGFDVDGLLAGARACDEATRVQDLRRNPAALLALMWHHAGGGHGARDMVILPYRDRLLLFSRYLQQLVMESLGKEKDLEGRVVHQGIAVYGNKGSTDQHAYVQQLRDGLDNFFVTFVDVLQARDGASPEVEPQVTSGDYLHGFLLGTREALRERGRGSITLTVRHGDARDLGVLIALYERAVGLYASLVGINAYHQPGVEAGKKAAGAVIDLQRQLLRALEEHGPGDAAALAAAAGVPERVETAWHVLERLAADPARGIRRRAGARPWETVFSLEG
ncbi:MAG: glucose-6-phosphate isomerase [Acidobacteriota bacterium]|jgi:glucose-6-phosphate isomerase